MWCIETNTLTRHCNQYQNLTVVVYWNCDKRSCRGCWSLFNRNTWCRNCWGTGYWCLLLNN